MKPLVIYHANCADGFGAAFAAWLKLGDEAEYVAMQYGSVKTPEDFDMKVSLAAKNNNVYILDFSFPKEVMSALFANAKRVIWLDHHKTAFELYGWECGGLPKNAIDLPNARELLHHDVILDNTRSGALLAWEYFHPGEEVPILIQHIDDHDRWVFAIEGTKEFNKALWSYAPWSFELWRDIFLASIFSGEAWRVPDEFYIEGAAILRAHGQNVASVVKHAVSCLLHVPTFNKEGDLESESPESGLTVNCPSHLASDVGHQLANQSGTFGLTWSMDSEQVIRCSLRSNGDYDVSAIAKAFGGGGHKNAAGFSTDIQTLLGWLK